MNLLLLSLLMWGVSDPDEHQSHQQNSYGASVQPSRSESADTVTGPIDIGPAQRKRNFWSLQAEQGLNGLTGSIGLIASYAVSPHLVFDAGAGISGLWAELSPTNLIGFIFFPGSHLGIQAGARASYSILDNAVSPIISVGVTRNQLLVEPPAGRSSFYRVQALAGVRFLAKHNFVAVLSAGVAPLVSPAPAVTSYTMFTDVFSPRTIRLGPVISASLGVAFR